MIPLHAGHATALAPSTRLAIAAVAGLAATLVMTGAMRAQSYGYVPAYVAAGAVWGRAPNAVGRRAADATLLTAGVLAGLGYGAALIGTERARGSLGVDVEYAIAGLVSVAAVLVGALLVGLLHAVFAWLVFPRFGGNAYATRPSTVRRQWAVSAVVYGLVLVVLVAAMQESLPA